MDDLLRLVALDPEDLAIVSAHLQDAIVRTGDLTYLPAEKRFAIVARRFEWEGASRDQPRRRLTGLHFERVTHVRVRNIDRGRVDEPLNLMAITFDETDAPSGTATLVFSGARAIQLDVECIEAQMKDLGPMWATRTRPIHDVGAETA